MMHNADCTEARLALWTGRHGDLMATCTTCNAVGEAAGLTGGDVETAARPPKPQHLVIPPVPRSRTGWPTHRARDRRRKRAHAEAARDRRRARRHTHQS